jgi:hypothetical protein
MTVQGGQTRYNLGRIGNNSGTGDGEFITAADYAALSALGLGQNWAPDGQGGYMRFFRADQPDTAVLTNGATANSGINLPEPGDQPNGQANPAYNPSAPIGPQNQPYVTPTPTPPTTPQTWAPPANPSYQPTALPYQPYTPPPQNTDLDSLLHSILTNPNPYDDSLVSSMWQSQAGDIDNQYDQANRGLTANLAQRGITDSTFGGQQRTAKEQAAEALAEQVASANAAAKSNAINEALGVQNLYNNESQFGANFNLAQQFGISDRNRQTAQDAFNNELSTENFNANQQSETDRLYEFLVSMGLI